MPKVDRVKFKQDAASRGRGSTKFSDWKSAGETVGFIHPKVGLWERWTHGSLPSVEENDKGETVMRKRRPNCVGQRKEHIPHSGCPTCQLQEFAAAKIAEGFDGDEVILDGGSGKERFVLDLTDLAGAGDFRSNPKVKSEVCFAWMPKDADTSDLKSAVEIITGPHTMGERMLEVIDDQISARGEVLGDCQVPAGFELKMRKGSLVLVSGEESTDWKPYPLKLKFKKDARPESMYSAAKMDADLCPLTPEVMQVMLAEPEDLDLDFEKMCQPTEAVRQLGIIQSAWESKSIPYEEFKAYFEERSGVKVKGKKEKVEQKEESHKKTTTKQEPRAEVAEGPSNAPVFCPNCGFKNAPGAKFCQGCGNKLVGAVEPKEESQEEKVSAKPKESAKPAPVKGQVRCPECGEMVEPMKPSNRCPDCGEKIVDADVPM